jgi:hypothetical protein
MVALLDRRSFDGFEDEVVSEMSMMCISIRNVHLKLHSYLYCGENCSALDCISKPAAHFSLIYLRQISTSKNY